MNAGHSFPDFPQDQDRWKGTFYPSFGLDVLFANHLSQNWMVDVGLGFTAYFLTNRGPVDKYILDFGSPHASTGISYIFGKRSSKRGVLKLSYGIQLGYKGEFIDEFETYTVTVQGEKRCYHYLKSELGIRQFLKKKRKGTKYKTAFEFGTYFRLNLNSLGTVVFAEPNFSVSSEPQGNLIGVYYKFLFPAGRKRIKVKSEEVIEEIPPLIYNPRYSR